MVQIRTKAQTIELILGKGFSLGLGAMPQIRTKKTNKRGIKMSMITAFNNFMRTGFKDAVEASTRASWGGSGYSVELFDDGHYRVIWDNNIGSCYNSPGMILSIPALTTDEWDDDPNIRFYDNAEEYMRDYFREKWEENLKQEARNDFFI